jgi:hypothetical protein
MGIKLAAVWFLALVWTIQIHAQVHSYMLDKTWNGLTWTDFVVKTEQNFPVTFYYQSDSMAGINILISEDSISLARALNENLESHNLFYAIDRNGNIFISQTSGVKTKFPDSFFTHHLVSSIVPDTNQEAPAKDNTWLQTRKEYVARTVVIGNRKAGMNNKRPVLSGTVRNAQDGSPIISGNLYIEELEKGTTTDDLGRYNMTLRKGNYTLNVSSLDSESEKYKLVVLSSGTLDIELIPKLYTLEEFVVSSEKEHNVRGSQMGFEKISVKSIKEVPVVLGEKDIIKVALMLPGVQTVGEGASGFNVRGSPADQNQFYINEVPVYNSSHLFGFFSAFNSDAISNFTLLKSNIPADYGGRLSSIFDITSKTGDFQQFKASGGISPVTARLVAEGPFKKDHSSYMVGLRSTYSDWILRSMQNSDLNSSSAYFGDAIANFAIKLNPRNEIRLFTYYSYDDADINTLSENTYENMGGALSWVHYIKDKHALDLSLAQGNYQYEDRNTEYEQFAYKISYALSHTELKANLSLHPNEHHTLLLGANSILYESKPGDYLPYNEASSIVPRQFEPEKGIETGIYLNEQWDITPDLQISAGLRYNLYSYLGPKTVYSYYEGEPRSISTISDTTLYQGNELIKTYDGIDYRFSARYIINDHLSVKGSVNRLHQYIFMLSNTIAISPTDAWKLTDYNIKPMRGDQYSLGLYSNVLADIFEVSVEGYYKDVKNLVEFKDGAQMIANEIPETDIVQGDLEAYGLEFMVKKPLGRLNGWVNYTWSHAMVEVNNPETGEMNNFGQAYPANYDKPHAFNLVANYKLSRRISFSGNVVFSTGRPITYPTAIYFLDDIKLVHYSVRNEYRLPNYFRIDLSVNVEGNLKAKKFAHGSWNFSVYNLTGRNNAYSVYFKSENGQVRGYKLSIFAVPVFSVTYNFKLGNFEN